MYSTHSSIQSHLLTGVGITPTATFTTVIPNTFINFTSNTNVTVSGQSNAIFNGTYAITFSTNYNTGNYGAWNCWVNNTQMWASVGVYTAGGVAYSGGKTTVVGGTTIYGEWNQMKCPNAFILAKYKYDCSLSYVDYSIAWTLAGSNNGTTWTALDTVTGNSSLIVSRTLASNTTAYSYYRFINQFSNSTYSFAKISFYM